MLKKGQIVFPKPQLEGALEQLFVELGVPQGEWEDSGLDISNTPKRIARMLRDELLTSYRPGARDELLRRFTCFNSDGEDAMVVEGPISFYSMCAHHMLSFSGEAYVGYIPDRLIIGASKIPRVIDFFARMLQIQERLARQTADFILEHAQPRWVGVLLVADHLCMQVRGVKQANSRMVTTAIRPQPTITQEDRGVIDEFYRQVEMLRKG